jgi:hypothetical protein
MALSPVTAEPLRTQGHLDVPPFALTRVSPSARAAYLALVTDSTLPDDATVAMTHQPASGEPRGPTYVMERRAGQWRYLTLDGRGGIESEDGRACGGCHAAAVAEGLFGPPRPKETPPKPRE